jgi:Uma2 family endonuclease
MGYEESILAVFLARALGNFVTPRNLGHVSGEAGMIRLYPGLVRIPDVAFAPWDRFPNRRLNGEPIPQLAPDLVIEVLGRSNTAAEMTIKVDEYFSAGVRQIWLVDPKSRSVTRFDAADRSTVLSERDVLDGGDVLPGFTISLSELFDELERHG